MAAKKETMKTTAPEIATVPEPPDFATGTKAVDVVPRDLRLRNQFFAGAEGRVFDTTTKGYGPLPILLRKLLRHLTPPEVRVLIYLYTRASKYRICYPSVDEIAEELGVNRKNVTPHLRSLAQKKLIETRTAKGRQYFLMLDPRVALESLVATGEIHDDELFLLNELCRELKREPFAAPKATRTAGAA